MSMDKVIEKKKGLKKKHFYIAAGVLLLVFLIYQIGFGDHQSVFRAEKDKLTVSTVEDGQFNDYITIIEVLQRAESISIEATLLKIQLNLVSNVVRMEDHRHPDSASLGP